MLVSFGSAELAALCNSETALAQRWGRSLAAKIGQRLLDLSAITAVSIDLIPGTRMTPLDDGAAAIDFSGEFSIRGVVRPRPGASDHILITSLEVHGSDRYEHN